MPYCKKILSIFLVFLIGLFNPIFVLATTTDTTTPSNTVTGLLATTNLKAYWAFNESSGTTATDSSGNNNNATLVNSPTFTTGISGNSLLVASSQSGTVADNVNLRASAATSLLPLGLNRHLLRWLRSPVRAMEFKVL